MMISYAQNFEDVILARAFKNQSSGFYIDVGTFHPETDSVSKNLYDKGWRGINIEPLHEQHALISAERPRDINLNVAVSCIEGTIRFHRVKNTGLSTTRPEYAHEHSASGFDVDSFDVPSISLKKICDRYASNTAIDFLKIDVEGAEADVISSADWINHRPRIVLVEATVPRSTIPSHSEWEPTLLKVGYSLRYFDGLNRWYTQSNDSELQHAFYAPPNTFDEFITAQTNEYQKQMESLELRLRSAMTKADRLDSLGRTIIGKIILRIIHP